jgi:hypothetical protein
MPCFKPCILGKTGYLSQNVISLSRSLSWPIVWSSSAGNHVIFNQWVYSLLRARGYIFILESHTAFHQVDIIKINAHDARI